MKGTLVLYKRSIKILKFQFPVTLMEPYPPVFSYNINGGSSPQMVRGDSTYVGFPPIASKESSTENWNLHYQTIVLEL